ncbi:amino acid adenylation domain-containing protein [Algoriphagus sp. 4150]|uniref:amino acid adenylation domain-containing protein n=1 Tax=Algoriphagus sp. 4150 TaxID=2817756 RepID=UPI00285B5F52|nr:amino acid adenylation domain-containing protein [Algoriphagus sp. 4150]MDR7132633.1 amino acid adenylation domain-containing protein [Algoriphagus sp. 4150]
MSMKLEDAFHPFNYSTEGRKTPLPAFVSIGELIKGKLAAGKDRTAVCVGGEEYSYARLDEMVNSIAAQLVLKGAGPGEIVGVHIERTIDLVASALAVIQIGACYMPIDSEYPEDRVKFMLGDVDVRVFLTDNDSYSWGNLDCRKLKIDRFIFEHHSPGVMARVPRPDDPSFIVYTSGSTGNPKGVALSRQNLSDFLKHFEKAPGYSESDRVMGLSSISFDMSFMEIVLPFVYGASLHLLDRFERRDPREIVKILKTGKITKLFATPSHLKSIVDYGLSDKQENLTIISAGEPLQHTLALSLVKSSGKVYNIYGPTETTIFTNIKEITADTEVVTIGKPVPGTTILLMDEHGKPVTDSGELGEIYIGGKGVGLGYLNREELNREKFILDPLPNKLGRYYRTGDLAVWTADGELICKGRMDQQVKIRGQRVELCEIENAIALDKAVEHVIVEKTTAENGDDELIALLSFRNGEKLSGNPDKWIASCKNKLRLTLPTYMVPGNFVVVDNFELNQNGKVDRKNARKLFQPVAVESSFPPASTQTKGKNETVNILLELWNKFLEISDNQLDEDFFFLGGHSLLAVDLISAVEKKFGLNLPLLFLFEYPTVNSMALKLDRLTAAKTVESSVLVRFKEGNPEKVLFFIHGVGLNPIEIKTLNEYMDDDQTIWGLQSPGIQNKKNKPLDNIEEIAGLYIAEIKKLGYSGQYKLLGNSFGGQIAFEMAKQLLNAGEEIGFLGMIDTVASIKSGYPKNVFGRIGMLGRKIPFEISFLLDDPVFYLKYRVSYIKEKVQKNRIPKTPGDDGDLKARIMQIESINMKAWENYKHEFIDTTITLFLAEKRTFFVPDFDTFGWSEFVRHLKTVHMPGEHANMLKPPHGEKFSRTLQNLLNSSD